MSYHIDKDPALQQQAQQVWQQMSNIISEHEPQDKSKPTNAINTIGMEQAIRELLELQKQIKP